MAREKHKQRRRRHRYLTEIQQGLTPNERLNRIVEDAMCIGCGLCQSVAGSDRVNMRLVENLTERPIAVGALDHDTMDRIYQVCPGTRVEGLPESQIDDDSQYDLVWGFWRRLELAWSADPAVRHIGSTGGVLTALALYLVEQGEVDFILHAKAPKERPAFGTPTISRSRIEVIEAAGSRYGPTATLSDVRAIVDRAERSGERFAFIGTPCDVSGLRNLATQDPRVDQTCRYMLTMVCGGFMAPTAMARFLDQMGTPWPELKSLRYRGHGCPGPTRMETLDGTVVEKNYLDFWGEDESAWQLPFRCKICPDGIGDAADIAASDTWDGGAPPREGQENDLGSNAVIARSERGEALLRRAVAAGYVATGESLTPRDMDRLQPHQRAKKLAVWARFVGMRGAGRIVPDVARLRLKALARENSLTENLAQARGTRRRCLDGSNSEKTPKSVE